MKLLNPDLSSFINLSKAQQFKSFLFYGSDFSYMQTLLRGFIDSNELLVRSFIGSFNVQDVYVWLSTHNFFGKSTLIKISHSKVSLKDIQILLNQLNKTSNFLCFVYDQQKLQNTDILEFFIKSSHLLAVECSYLNKQILREKIIHMLQTYNLKYSSEALVFLVNFFQNKELFFLNYMIERLSVLPQSTISLSDVRKIFYLKTETTLDMIFSMIHNADLKFNDMALDFNDILLIRYFIRNYSVMYLILLLGVSGTKLHFAKFNLYPWLFNKLLSVSVIYSSDMVAKILVLLNDLEVEVKKNKRSINLFCDILAPIRELLPTKN